MTTATVILIIIAIGVAIAVSFYQYLYQAKNKSRVTYLLAFLRFLSIFSILLLLINPVISRKTLEIQKTPLPVVIDNSASIRDLKANTQALEVFNSLRANPELQEKFEVQAFQFDSEFQPAVQIDFKGNQSKIDVVGNQLKSIHKNQSHPVVLVTDGNQTSGEDYSFSFARDTRVYPIVVGDTNTVFDLKIAQLNANKYAFHKNKFPVEIFLQYAGTKTVAASLKIAQGNTLLHTENLVFSSKNKSKVVQVVLPAEKIGLQLFKAVVSSNESEKNTYNNTKNFAVEVLDQKTEVALVTAVSHPDIGALLRSIESNSQRKVTILKPNQINDLNRFNVVIWYQPNASFKEASETVAKLGTNVWYITGNGTDYNWLNQYQNFLQFKMSGQKENYFARFDTQFNLFAVDNFGFENYPPLENLYGKITAKTAMTTLLEASIQNVPLEQPLIAFSEQAGKRTAFLIGENSWKWRAHCYLDHKSFEKWDQFIDKIIQFLATSNSKKALVVSHERFYQTGEPIEITAQYFNKNYELDEKARLSITVTGKKAREKKQYDLVRATNAFKVNLEGLAPGSYDFTVKEENSNSSYSGNFEVLDFDMEKQFVNANLSKLASLAENTKGKWYLPNNYQNLVQELLSNPSYKPVQKTIVQKSPLIEWITLLIVLSVSLALEWFIRKYNGLL